MPEKENIALIVMIMLEKYLGEVKKGLFSKGTAAPAGEVPGIRTLIAKAGTQKTPPIEKGSLFVKTTASPATGVAEDAFEASGKENIALMYDRMKVAGNQPKAAKVETRVEKVEKSTRTIGETPEILALNAKEPLYPAKDSSPSKSSEKEEMHAHAVLMRIEKLEGKLEGTEETNKQTMQKILDLSERIGEIRSMVLERERKVNDIDISVTKVSDAMESIEPKKFMRKIENLSSKLAELEATVEKDSGTMDLLKGEISGMNEKTSKMGDITVLSGMHKEISKVLKDLESKKKEMFVLSSKTESMFGEMSSRFPELDSIKSKLDSYVEVLQDTLKDVDRLKTHVETFKGIEKFSKKLDDLVQKKDFDAVKTQITGDVNAINAKVGALSGRVDSASRRIENITTSVIEKKDMVHIIMDLGKRMNLLESEMQKIRQSDAIDNSMNRMLTEYEKINDAWKWDAEKRLKETDTSISAMTEKMNDIIREVQRNRQGISAIPKYTETYAGNNHIKTDALPERLHDSPPFFTGWQNNAMLMAGDRHPQYNVASMPPGVVRPSQSDVLKAALKGTDAAMEHIFRGEYREARVEYDNVLRTYCRAIATGINDPVAQINVIELYGKLKRVQYKLKNIGEAAAQTT